MTDPTAAQIVDQAWNEGTQPPPDQNLWEWSDEHRILGTDSGEQGKYQSERTPYVRGIAECLSPNHPASDITVMKGSQVGLTALGLNWIGYLVHLMPAPILITLPSEGVAREWSTQRLAQLVDDTEVLRGRIQDAAKRRSGNTTFAKKFSGGYFMKIAWSSSAKKLRSTPAKWLLSDEVDGFEGDTEGEGDPITLLNRRSTNFQGSKHFKISTPKDAASSRIHREFRAGDQRYYFVPCPKCRHHQVIKFPNIRFETAQPETVRLRCIKCGQPIPERFKTQLLQRGIWIATATNGDLLENGFENPAAPRIKSILTEMDVAEKASFHLSALYSPVGWYSWKQAAADWLEMKDDPKTLKVFVMTVQGEVWVNRGEAPKWEGLYERRKSTHVIGRAPQGVLFITAAIDTQKDRKEVEIVGWGRDLRSWSIAYERFDGNPEQASSWKPVEEYLAKPILHEAGAEMPIQVVVVDSGNWANIVYGVVGRHPQPYVSPAAIRITKPGTWLASKGGHSFNRLLEGVSSEDASRKRGGLKVFTIGTGFAKLEWYEWLNAKPREADGKIQIPSGYAEFPDYQPWYFQGIVAERMIITEAGARRFVTDPSVRNEPLDIRLMNRLGAHLMLPPRQAAHELFYGKLERELVKVPRPLKSKAAIAAPAVPEAPKQLTAPKPKYSGDGWV
jgi:phage terminase large subunit GpA-like protein